VRLDVLLVIKPLGDPLVLVSKRCGAGRLQVSDRRSFPLGAATKRRGGVSWPSTPAVRRQDLRWMVCPVQRGL